MEYFKLLHIFLRKYDSPGEAIFVSIIIGLMTYGLIWVINKARKKDE